MPRNPRFASNAPVANEGMRPCTALKPHDCDRKYAVVFDEPPDFRHDRIGIASVGDGHRLEEDRVSSANGEIADRNLAGVQARRP